MRWLLPGLAACGSGADTKTEDTAPEPLALEGASYELSTGGLTVPAADDGLADVLRLFFTRTVLIGVFDFSDAAMTVRIGFAVDGAEPLVQDPCTPTVELPPATLTGTHFEIGPADTTFQGAATTYSIGQMYVAGEIGGDGDVLSDIVLDGIVDLRQAGALGSFGDADALCTTVGSFSLPCAACDDGEPYCVTLAVEGLGASRVDGLTMTGIAAPATTCPTE